MKTKIKILTILDLNLFGKSYIQLDTNKGSFLIKNKRQADNFLNKYEVIK